MTAGGIWRAGPRRDQTRPPDAAAAAGGRIWGLKSTPRNGLAMIMAYLIDWTFTDFDAACRDSRSIAGCGPRRARPIDAESHGCSGRFRSTTNRRAHVAAEK
jgi:hypothetical protein